MTKAEDCFGHTLQQTTEGIQILRQYPILYSDIQGKKSHFILDLLSPGLKSVLKLMANIMKTKDEDQLR